MSSPAKKSKALFILLILFCTVLLAGTSLWVALKRGFTIDRVGLSSVQIRNISLKADNGLIVAIERLNIAVTKENDTLPDPGPFIEKFNSWAHLFREIRIEQVNYQDHVYSLLFNDNQFNLSGDLFRLSSTISYENEKIRLYVSELEIMPYRVKVTGKGFYIPREEQFHFTGRFNDPEISGDLTISYQPGLLTAKLKTGKFANLGKVLQQLSLDRELTGWISENISARNYQVNELRATIPFRNGKLDVRPANIVGKAVATDAEIRFHPSLPSVQSRQIEITYANDRLSFNLEEPNYRAKALDGSSVIIDNLLIGKSYMDIHILTEAQLDSEIHEILEAYDIHVPFIQKTGTTRADLHLLCNLPECSINAEGTFTTGEGAWAGNGIPFRTDGAAVRLDDELVIVEKAAVAYQDIFQAGFTGYVNTAVKSAVLKTDIERFELLDGEQEIIKVHNLVATPLEIDFSGDVVEIGLPREQVKLSIGPSRRYATASDLNKVLPYVPSLKKVPLQEGRLAIDFTHPENLLFEGTVTTSVLPVSANGQPVSTFSFTGSRDKEGVSATVNNGNISLNIAEKLSIKLHNYLVTIDTETIGSEAIPSFPVPIVITGPKSLIKTRQVSIPTHAFSLELSDKRVGFFAALDQGRLLFESRHDGMTLTGSDLDAMLVQDFFDYADLEGGRFNLSLKKLNNSAFEGYAEFSNVLIKDLLLLNNILSFFNTIPALATLSSPGFDKDGYRIKEGIVHFSQENGLLKIPKLRTDGTTINLEAQGWVDLEKDQLEMEMEVISLKDYSKIISKIPWAGYVILGENGSIGTSLDISGNRENPAITTNLGSEIVMLPVNMVKRTIQWPFKLFGNLQEGDPQEPETQE